MTANRARPVLYRRVRIDPLAERRRLGVMGYVTLVILVPVFAIVLTYVKMNSDQAKLKRQLSELRRVFGQNNMEHKNIELDVERFRSGTRIFAQNQRLGLGLQMPQHGQVTRVRNGVPVQGRGPQAEAIVAER
jgi:cell division protein FtsL